MQPTTKRKAPVPSKEPFPWVWFLLLLGSIYLFWIVPFEFGIPAPKITFTQQPLPDR